MTETNDIIATKRSAQIRLLSIPGVSAVGVGPKLINGQRTGDLAIIVVVLRKRPLGELPPDEQVPNQIGGFKTDVVQAGPALPDNFASGVATSNVTSGEDKAKYDVLRGGIQISRFLNPDDGAGTLGGIAYRLSDRRPVLVTCQHVLHPPGETAPGCAHSVGQPAGQDCCECMDFCAPLGGHDGRIVAHERQNAVFSNTVDGAIAELVSGATWAPEIQDEPNPIRIGGTHAIDVLDLPVDPDDLTLRYDVYKRGRTTRKTHGWVHAVDYSGSLNYGTSKSPVVRTYDHAIWVWTDADKFSDPGDSGAVIMNTTNDAIVGLHFAGQAGTVDTANDRVFKSGIASAVDKVESQLAIEFATAANTPPGVQTVQPHPTAPRRGEIPLPSQVASDFPPPSSTVTPESGPARELRSVLARTPLGQGLALAVLRHREEIRTLARTCPRVIVGWRHYGGPHILHRLQADIPTVPATINGLPFAESVRRFAAIVLLYAGEELATDVMRCAAAVEDLGGLTYPELLAACDKPIVASTP